MHITRQHAAIAMNEEADTTVNLTCSIQVKYCKEQTKSRIDLQQ